MKVFWEERYSQKEFAYGKEPNEFFKETLMGLKPGRILLPAEGEGRNAVYAARKGWEVEAFDFSEAAREKAALLARSFNVSITYEVEDYLSFRPILAPFDAVALIYSHTDSSTRKQFYGSIRKMLKPSGLLIVERFSKNQLGNDSGGPKNLDMLIDKEELATEFQDFEIQSLEEIETELNEGPYHVGLGSVVRMIAIKK